MPGNCFDLQGSASAAVSFSDTPQTIGPVRPGWIVYSVQATGGGVDGAASTEVQFGPYSDSASKEGPEPFPPGTCFTDYLAPFTLGEYFDVSLTAFAFIEGGDIGEDQVSSSVTFSLFESDGVTPVAIQESPEPTSLLLAGLGLMALFGATSPRKEPRESR
jgi:hypothetical protein